MTPVRTLARRRVRIRARTLLRPAALACATAATGAALAGCASHDAPDGTGAGPLPTPVAATSAPATGGLAPTLAPSPSAVPRAGGPAPAVSGATDLRAKPRISAGTGSPPDALVVKDLVTGRGPAATQASTVTVRYVGVTYRDGREFDSSWGRGQPATFSLDQLIPGFRAGVAGMRAGGRRELVVPPSLAYGDTGQGPVGPGQTLVFVVDLIAVR